MTTYREADVPTRLEQVDARLHAIDERLGAHDCALTGTNANRKGHVPAWAIVVGVVVAIGGIVICMTQMLQHDDAVEQRQRADCQTLCGSMGLNGGIVMPWSGWCSGQSCVCGDGHGSSVRVDPDGTQSTARDPWTDVR